MGEIAQLEELLKHMLQPNTDVVRQATQTLNKILKQHTSIPLLLELTFNNPHAEIRQIAAVLARKKIIGHWGKLPKDVHENTKKALLHALLNDTVNESQTNRYSPSVRRNIASLISILARALIPTGQWNELLDFLFQCTQSTNPDHREIALQLFNSLTETIGDHLRPHFQLLTKIFLKGLQDNEGQVRITALKAVGTLVQWVETESELAVFRELLPVICETIGYCITHNHNEEAVHAFEIFDDLIEMPHVVLGAIIPDIARFVLSVAANETVDIDVRQRALTVIQWIVTFKPKVVKKNKMIPAILQVVFPMCADPSDEESEAEELTNHKFAAQMMDVLTNNINSKHTFQPIAEYIAKYAQSAKKEDRRAAVIISAVIAEGCHEPMRDENTLKNLLNVVYSALKDNEQVVREAGCVALGQFSKHLQPEIIEHYQTILPFLFSSLNDPTNEVRISSCYAIEAFCENLGEEILPFIQPLMERLVQLLQGGDKEIQEMSISAISSTAAAAKQAFIPYFNVMLPFLVQLLKITNLDDIMLRCRATECMGIIASAVGRETFHPVLKEIMEMVLQGMPIDSNELREFSYGFFANVAEIEKANFIEYLPIIVPMLLASCESTDGITGVNDDQEAPIEGIDSDEEEEEYSTLHVRTAFLDEKASAVHAIGMLAEHVGAQFAPFLGPILKQFESLVHHFDEDVRQGTIISYKQLAMSVNAAFPSAPWQKGVAEKDAPMSPNMRQFIDTLVPIYIAAIQTDDDKQTVGSAVECIAELGKLFGPPALEKHMPSIVTNYISILEKKTACQTNHDDQEFDEEEDVEDIELILIEAVCDSIVDLVKVFGPLADPYFAALAQSVAKYQNKSETASYRSLAIGTLAEMSVAFGFSVANYVKILAPFAMKGMKDSDAETRSNSSYLWGMLAQNSSVAAYEFYPEALQLLAALFNDNSGVPNLLDNAAAAVARMIIAGASLIPLPQVLPALLKSVPLRKDFQENEAVYKCIFDLVKSVNPAVAPNIAGVLSSFAKSLGHKDVQQEIQAEIVNITKGLIQQYGAQLDQVIKSLPNDEQQNLQKYLS